MVIIRSEANKTYRELARLHKTRAIVKSGKALVPGSKVIEELLHSERERCLALIVEEGSSSPFARYHELPVIMLARSLFRALDRWGCGPPLLLFRATPYPAWSKPSWPSGCSVVVPFQDPRNVGATLRSAAAFEVSAVILTKEAAHPMHPDAVRACAGTESMLELFVGPPLKDACALPQPLFALDLVGTPLPEIVWPTAFGLIAGIEGEGMPSSLLNVERITIPTAPGVDSLNASTALGIALYAWRTGSRFPDGSRS